MFYKKLLWKNSKNSQESICNEMEWFLYNNGSVMKGLRVNKEPVKDLYIALVARVQIQKILILVTVSSPDILFLIFNISLNNLEATFW